jgi:hypothetical protein
LDRLDDTYEADTFVKCLDLTSLDLSVDEGVLKAEERIRLVGTILGPHQWEQVEC